MLEFLLERFVLVLEQGVDISFLDQLLFKVEHFGLQELILLLEGSCFIFPLFFLVGLCLRLQLLFLLLLLQDFDLVFQVPLDELRFLVDLCDLAFEGLFQHHRNFLIVIQNHTLQVLLANVKLLLHLCLLFLLLLEHFVLLVHHVLEGRYLRHDRFVQSFLRANLVHVLDILCHPGNLVEQTHFPRV